MRKKILAFVFGAGTAAAHTDHTACTGGAVGWVDEGAVMQGPGEGPDGGAVSDAASDRVGHGVSDALADLHTFLCD